MHWYHPHAFGSSMIQTFSANGVVIVEGAQPAGACGCQPASAALPGSPCRC